MANGALLFITAGTVVLKCFVHAKQRCQTLPLSFLIFLMWDFTDLLIISAQYNDTLNTFGLWTADQTKEATEDVTLGSGEHVMGIFTIS